MSLLQFWERTNNNHHTHHHHQVQQGCDRSTSNTSTTPSLRNTNDTNENIDRFNYTDNNHEEVLIDSDDVKNNDDEYYTPLITPLSPSSCSSRISTDCYCTASSTTGSSSSSNKSRNSSVWSRTRPIVKRLTNIGAKITNDCDQLLINYCCRSDIDDQNESVPYHHHHQQQQQAWDDIDQPNERTTDSLGMTIDNSLSQQSTTRSDQDDTINNSNQIWIGDEDDDNDDNDELLYNTIVVRDDWSVFSRHNDPDLFIYNEEDKQRLEFVVRSSDESIFSSQSVQTVALSLLSNHKNNDTNTDIEQNESRNDTTKVYSYNSHDGVLLLDGHSMHDIESNEHHLYYPRMNTMCEKDDDNDATAFSSSSSSSSLFSMSSSLSSNDLLSPLNTNSIRRRHKQQQQLQQRISPKSVVQWIDMITNSNHDSDDIFLDELDRIIEPVTTNISGTRPTVLSMDNNYLSTAQSQDVLSTEILPTTTSTFSKLPTTIDSSYDNDMEPTSPIFSNEVNQQQSMMSNASSVFVFHDMECITKDNEAVTNTDGCHRISSSSKSSCHGSVTSSLTKDYDDETSIFDFSSIDGDDDDIENSFNPENLNISNVTIAPTIKNVTNQTNIDDKFHKTINKDDNTCDHNTSISVLQKCAGNIHDTQLVAVSELHDDDDGTEDNNNRLLGLNFIGDENMSEISYNKESYSFLPSDYCSSRGHFISSHITCNETHGKNKDTSTSHSDFATTEPQSAINRNSFHTNYQRSKLKDSNNSISDNRSRVPSTYISFSRKGSYDIHDGNQNQQPVEYHVVLNQNGIVEDISNINYRNSTIETSTCTDYHDFPFDESGSI